MGYFFKQQISIREGVLVNACVKRSESNWNIVWLKDMMVFLKLLERKVNDRQPAVPVGRWQQMMVEWWSLECLSVPDILHSGNGIWLIWSGNWDQSGTISTSKIGWMDLHHSVCLILIVHSDRLLVVHLLMLSSHLYDCLPFALPSFNFSLQYGVHKCCTF